MRKLTFIIISIIIGIGIAVVSLEVLLRLNPSLYYVSSFYQKRSESLTKKLMARKRPSLLLGFENIPNANGINSYGLVSRDYKLRKNKNTFRILILGDSVGEGFDNEYLENLLNGSSSLSSRYNFEIWNGSVGGYDVRRFYLYLKYRGLNYAPDMVIIFFCLRDFDINTSIFYLDEKGVAQQCFFVDSAFFRRCPPSPFLMRHSFLYRFVILHLNAYLLNLDSTKQLRNDGAYYLKSIKEICEKNKLPIFGVIFPYLKPLSEYYDYQRRQYRDIKQALIDNRLDYLDLHEYTSGIDLYSLRNEKNDEIHTKGKNTFIFGNAIFLHLLNNYF